MSKPIEDPRTRYTLFAPISSTTASMIDSLGRVVHQWALERSPALSVYLLDDGHLLETGGDRGPGSSGFDVGGAEGRDLTPGDVIER